MDSFETQLKSLQDRRKNLEEYVAHAIEDFNRDNVLEVSGIGLCYNRQIGGEAKPVVNIKVSFKNEGSL